jgi:hypothetical protein
MEIKQKLWLKKLEKNNIVLHIEKEDFFYYISLKENFNNWKLLNKTLMKLQIKILDSIMFKTAFQTHYSPFQKNLPKNFYELFLTRAVFPHTIILDFGNIKSNIIPANSLNATCDFVKEIRFNKNLKRIKENSFNNLYNVRKIALPENVIFEKNTFSNSLKNGIHITKNSELYLNSHLTPSATIALLRWNLLNDTMDPFKNKKFELKILRKNKEPIHGNLHHFVKMKSNQYNYSNLGDLKQNEVKQTPSSIDNQM